MTPESGAEKRYFSKSEKTIKVRKKSEAEEGGVRRGGGRGKRSGQKKGNYGAIWKIETETTEIK